MRTMLKKTMRDIKLFKGRTALALVGVLIGVAAVGAVLSAYSILTREMQRNFMGTNPASMVLVVPNLDNRAEGIIKSACPNALVDIGKTVQARISRSDGTWGTIILRAVRSFENQTVDTFTLEKGCWAESRGQLMLERDCLKILPNLTSGTGETVKIMLPGGPEVEMLISGTVHAPELAPASMENYSYGFVTLDTLKSLGYMGGYDEIRIVSLKDRFSLVAMQTMVMDVKAHLASNGYTVGRVDVPPPGKHPHADQLSSLLFLLQAFTLISLLAACLIIVNLMNFIMSRQARQIAVQKAVGGTTHEIALPYFIYVLIISIAATAISIPLSIAAGCGYAVFATGILNFDVASFSIPAWVFAVQILVGFAAPLAAAAYPVLKSCSASVKDAMSDMPGSMGQKRADKAPSRRSIALALPVNNLLRRRGRTLLAVMALAAGGSLFMTAQNITASIGKTVDTSIAAFKWDYDVRLAGVYDRALIDKAAANVPGLSRWEIWQGSSGFFEMPSGVDTSAYQIKIAPEGTCMLSLPGLESGGNAIVINTALADAEKWISPGTPVTLEAGGKRAGIIVRGVINEVPAIPAVYVSADAYAKLFGAAPMQVLMASSASRDYMAQRAVTKGIETGFAATGIKLAENWNIYVLRKAFVDHLNVIVGFLSVMALLAVAVGGLGIGSAIGINVSERRHETGVLRAMGATPRRIYALVLVEVLLMGLTGWLLGTASSWPISVFVGNYFGQIFLHTDLANTLSLPGSVAWLGVSLAVALLSGYLPARMAARSPLRDMLAYE